MEVVADASTLLAVTLDEPERPAILDATVGVTLIAPEVLPWEVGNALSAMSKRGRLERKLVSPAWEAVQRIPVRLVPVEVEASLTLALELGIYAYDAYYLQCAATYRRPLITLDRQMRRIAASLGISCLIQ
ncbi:MAG: type II toxin-antitoxin system VapC family toxin [Holophagales bacterium]|nr:type II toxin-antitoxin system VapC family toxin [Holophagales bacterium]